MPALQSPQSLHDRRAGLWEGDIRAICLGLLLSAWAGVCAAQNMTITTTQIATTSIASTVTAFLTTGYATAGDGGQGQWSKSSGCPANGKIQSMDGQCWALTGPAFNVLQFGADPTDTNSSVTAINNALAYAAGSPVSIPAGVYKCDGAISYTTSTQYAPGAKLQGDGPNKTFIDVQVAGATAPCMHFGSTTPSAFQFGGYVRGLTFETTTHPTAPVGLDLLGVYQQDVSNVMFNGLTGGVGAQITETSADASASNVVTFDHDWFINNAKGLNSNFDYNDVQTSFVRVSNSSFFSNSTCGWCYIGLQGSMVNTGFAQNAIGFWAEYNGASNAEFSAQSNSFENNVLSVQIDSALAWNWAATEIAETVESGTTQGIVMGTGSYTTGVASFVSFKNTTFRIGRGYNHFAGFTLNLTAVNSNDTDTSWQSFDAAGQTRYAINSSASGDQMGIASGVMGGSSAGAFNIALMNGENGNVAIPLDGNIFTFTGLTASGSVTGLTNGRDGRHVLILNNTNQTITVDAENSNSLVANRLRTNGATNLTLSNLGTLDCTYYTSASRWLCGVH